MTLLGIVISNSLTRPKLKMVVAKRVNLGGKSDG